MPLIIGLRRGPHEVPGISRVRVECPGAASRGEETGMSWDPPPAGRMPYFFLSYARTPRQDPSDPSDPDRWVHKLYRDLCEHILNLTNAQPGSAGFMDRETRPGDEWPRELAQALATCRVFVPLYSPRYFE